MKIVLIAPTYLPARQANTIQVMKMAQALKRLGHAVLVLVPGKNPGDSYSWDEFAHHYGLHQRFEIEWLYRNPNLRSYDYGVKSVRRAQQWGGDLIYTRLPQAAAIASFIGIPSIFEIHDLPQGKFGVWLFKRFISGGGDKVLVVITAALRDALISKFSTLGDISVILAPDGVDLSRYQKFLMPEEARQALHTKLHIPKNTFVAGYTGHLYPGRGADLILDIAEQLPDVCFLLVGGETEDVVRIRQMVKSRDLENVILTGFVPNAELPQYQAACDVLLMPYQHSVAASSGGDIAKYLSPMKLFEYLACGRAILSSDLPVLREILNEENAVLLPPDNPNIWVATIRDMIGDPEKRARLASQARLDAQKYSWKTRAQKIILAINPG